MHSLRCMLKSEPGVGMHNQGSRATATLFQVRLYLSVSTENHLLGMMKNMELSKATLF